MGLRCIETRLAVRKDGTWPSYAEERKSSVSTLNFGKLHGAGILEMEQIKSLQGLL